MLSRLPEFLPPSAVLAFCAWGGLSYFVTGPELASRIARADYVQACEANLAQSIERSFAEDAQELNRRTEAETTAPLISDYAEQLRRHFPEQSLALDMLTGGVLSMALDAPKAMARQAQAARDQARQALKERAQEAIAAAPNNCACQMRSALSESQSDWALYAGTLGLVESESVTAFPALMAQHAGQCAGRLG
ncbi:MAG: hypothetical protein AAGA97_01230 [Pseudomonadota bacterium]